MRGELEVHKPAGEYADLLALVCDANAFDFDGDLLSTLHEGLWAIMRQDGRTAQEAALVGVQPR